MNLNMSPVALFVSFSSKEKLEKHSAVSAAALVTLQLKGSLGTKHWVPTQKKEQRAG